MLSSTVISQDDPITSPTDLWEPVYMPTHNWKVPFSLFDTWNTDIQKAGSIKESRSSVLDRPYRILEPEALLDSITSSRLSDIYLERLGQARGLFPLLCDEVETTNASTTSFSGDFQYRRFYSGGRAVLINHTDNSFEYGIIDTASDTTVVLTGALSSSFPTGSSIIPLLEVYLTLDSDRDVLTDIVSSVPFSVEESTGETALPVISSSYAEYPTLPEYYHWESISKHFTTQGSSPRAGIGTFFSTLAAFPLRSYNIPMRLTRAEFWDIFSLFDSVKGMAKSFYIASPSSDFTLEAITTGSISVTAVGPVSAWDSIKAIAVVETDGSVVIGTVGSVARGAGTDVVTLSNTIPPVTLSDVRRTSIGTLCRFSSDELQEEWLTTEAMKTTLTIIEVLDI